MTVPMTAADFFEASSAPGGGYGGVLTRLAGAADRAGPAAGTGRTAADRLAGLTVLRLAILRLAVLRLAVLAGWP